MDDDQKIGELLIKRRIELQKQLQEDDNTINKEKPTE